MKQKVSIIVPVYNAEKTIEKCIESITNQEYKNIEIIIINDGSIDNTKKIVEKMQRTDNRIRLINQKNSGVSHSRNVGIKSATGEYISFIDGDDWIEPNFISLMIKKIEEYDVDVVRCNYIHEYQKKSEIGNLYDLSEKKFTKEEIASEKVLEHFICVGETIPNYVVLLLIKSRIAKKIRFNESLYMMEDALFYQELFNCINSIFFTNECIYHVIDNVSSATRDTKRVEKNILGIIDSGIKISDFIKKNKITVNKQNFNTYILSLIIKYINKLGNIGDYDKIKKIIEKLYQNQNFNYILKNSSYYSLSKFRRIIAKLLIKKKTNLIILIYRVRNKIFLKGDNK